MKKYIYILILIFCLLSCNEDETVDITVMPAITTSGENTFGCLVDGWLYVGGRFHQYDYYSDEWKSIHYNYNTTENEIYANVLVKSDLIISFTILSPAEGKECILKEIKFGEQELEDGTVLISRFDRKAKIVSGTFSNHQRLTDGRFDTHYKDIPHW